MTHGSLVLTLVTEKERAAYVTREISVMNKKVGFVLHNCFFLILYLIKNKTNEDLLPHLLLNLHEPKFQQMRVISIPESEINIEICQEYTCFLLFCFVFCLFVGYLHLKPTR